MTAAPGWVHSGGRGFHREPERQVTAVGTVTALSAVRRADKTALGDQAKRVVTSAAVEGLGPAPKSDVTSSGPAPPDKSDDVV